MALRLNRAVWLMALMLVGQPGIYAGTLRKVRELGLRKIVRGSPATNAAILPLQLLKFSPDGQQLAVAVAWDTSRNVFKSQLLVIDTQHPSDVPKQFEISAGVGNEEMPGATHFGWSPNSETVLAAGKVIHLENGAACELPRPTAPPYWPSVLIGNDRLIQGGPDLVDGSAVQTQIDAIREWFKDHLGLPYTPSTVPPPPPEPTSHFTFFDANCHPQEKWDVPQSWYVDQVSTDRGFISFRRELRYLNLPHGFRGGDVRVEIVIADSSSRKVLHRWYTDNGPYGQLAEGGKAICGGGDVEETGKAPLTCWDIDTGEKISEAPTVNGGEPVATAAHSSRIVASSYHRIKDPLSSYEYESVLDKRVVWDFRSGKELVSWKPEFQSYININNEREEEPSRFAISPDGQYIAEGGSGIVRLYHIEP